MASKDLSDLPDEFEKNLSNNLSVPELIINHQKYRFAQLYRLLESEPTITVVIPFNFKEGLELEHGLGKGLAVDQWTGSGYTKQDSDDSIANLTSLVNKLFEKFPEHVKYGLVGTKPLSKSLANWVETVIGKLENKNKLIGYNKGKVSQTTPSNKLYHVWGANVTNWNNNIGGTILGLSQASGMGKQNIGIFGVITTPVNTNSGNIENISSPSNTDTIDPYEKRVQPPSTYTNKILHIMKGWEKYLSDDSMKSLGTIINNSNEECSKCIYDNINDKTNEKDKIKEVVQILLDNSVIEKADYNIYIKDIDDKVSQQKYLKYKQKYLALKIYKNKL